MDIEKLYEKLLEDMEIKDIPIDYVFRIAVEVMKIISSGECFYKLD